MNTTASAETSAAAAAARESLSQDLHALVGDAQRLLDDASRYDDAQVTRLKERLRDELDRLRRQYGSAEAAAEARLRDAAQRADEAVHGHPYAAIGIAAAAGLLVGALIARR